MFSQNNLLNNLKVLYLVSKKGKILKNANQKPSIKWEIGGILPKMNGLESKSIWKLNEIDFLNSKYYFIKT